MSRASDRASASFGDVLVSGLATRGRGAQLPAQTTPQADVELPPEARLEELENRIQASVEGYQRSVRQLQLQHRQELGLLLEEIRADKRLYQAAGYKRFGHYIKGRWGWDRSYAYRLMDLALVRRALAPLGAEAVDALPEGQARPLAPVVRHNGDEAARELLQTVGQEATGSGKKVTAAAITKTRDTLKLGVAPSGELSPIGDSSEDEVVDAELVEDEDASETDDEAAELVNQQIRAAANTAAKAVRLLDEVLSRGVAPFDASEAAQDLSRIRSAAVRLERRAGGLPGPADS
ncbi:hypothetical protein [Streptomyces sp. BRA346]|uniref:hypothetical protein n=1 Tax=Streptomyces sp. BRA346 TaxID=2878199 RepID=UPI0040645F43